MKRTTRRTKRPLMIAAMSLVLALAMSLPALAAPKGGNGGGKGGKTTTNATLDAEQLADGTLHFWGCGYEPTKQVNFVIDTGYSTWFFYAGPDATGCVDVDKPSQGSGLYDIETNQVLNGKKAKVMAHTTLQVQ